MDVAKSGTQIACSRSRETIINFPSGFPLLIVASFKGILSSPYKQGFKHGDLRPRSCPSSTGLYSFILLF